MHKDRSEHTDIGRSIDIFSDFFDLEPFRGTDMIVPLVVVNINSNSSLDVVRNILGLLPQEA